MNDVQMTYLQQSSQPVGDGGDPYTGLDRFGRVIDLRWINASGADINRFKYGFDPAGNRLWRRNTVAPAGELWYLGSHELDNKMRELVEPLGVRCVDALAVRKHHPARILTGWESKPFSIIHSSFEEVLFLDADNVVVTNPEYLFESEPYLKKGAVFWPDFPNYVFPPKVWKVFAVNPSSDLQMESGQLLIDKRQSWKALRLCMWYNEHSDFFYQYTYGDKDTFQMAWKKAGIEYAMPAALPIRAKTMAIYQHDFTGSRIFQHRNRDKWQFNCSHREVPGFMHEDVCANFLKELKSKWCGVVGRNFNLNEKTREEKRLARMLMVGQYIYKRIGYDRKAMSFNCNGTIGRGCGTQEMYWDIRSEGRHMFLNIFSQNALTCTLKLSLDGRWRGRWEGFEKMPIELKPVLEIGPRHASHVALTSARGNAMAVDSE